MPRLWSEGTGRRFRFSGGAREDLALKPAPDRGPRLSQHSGSHRADNPPDPCPERER
jgi:hypothetical protein